MTYHWCSGYEELAAEVALAGATDSFVERLLAGLHRHGLTVDEGDTVSNGSIAVFTLAWRQALHDEIRYYQEEGLHHFLDTHKQIRGFNRHGLVRNQLIKDRKALL
eukprot:2437361-Rhodomonas_salina.1